MIERTDILVSIAPLMIGWILDLIFGDPARLPHPIVWFGKAIALLEGSFNKGSHRKVKGALTSIFLISGIAVPYHRIKGINHLISHHTGYP